MSFLDALLRDPAAFHVSISDRADRQRGSGTVSDPDNGGWQVKPGMKILGSGIDVTTIKLAAVSPVAPTQYFAIGHSLPTQTAEMVDAVEIQDLTIDASLPLNQVYVLKISS